MKERHCLRSSSWVETKQLCGRTGVSRQDESFNLPNHPNEARIPDLTASYSFKEQLSPLARSLSELIGVAILLSLLELFAIMRGKVI